MSIKSIVLPAGLANRCALALLTLASAAGCSTVGRSLPGIDNFDTVDPAPAALHRGGQPTLEGIATLRDMGVRSVLNLRDDFEPWEPEAVRQAGMAYLQIGMTQSCINEAALREAMVALRTLPRPIYVHCAAGRDRTGLVVALYRIVDQKMEREQAIGDLRAHGYNHFAYPGIERYLREFDPAALRAALP